MDRYLRDSKTYRVMLTKEIAIRICCLLLLIIRTAHRCILQEEKPNKLLHFGLPKGSAHSSSLGDTKPTTGSHYKSSTHARPTITVCMQTRSTSAQENPREKSVQVQVYSTKKFYRHSATTALSARHYGHTHHVCENIHLIYPASLRSAKRLHV